MTTPPEPTPRERHLRDVLVTLKARLRLMEADTGLPQGARTQAGKLADFITANVDRKGEGE